MAIEMGDRVRDRISGYEGIVVGITDWMYGCRRPMVQSTGLNTDGKPIELQSFDEPQLELLEHAAIAPSLRDVAQLPDYVPARTGGPQPTPARRPSPQR